MSSSQSYSDFERDYNTHLSKVRSFLAQPATNTSTPNYAANISHCDQALQNAKQCIHAMRGLAEIEGDPFKAEEAKRKLEREIGPLEEEIRGRKSGKSGGISQWEDNDLEYGEGSLTVPLTESERRMQDSEHLLRETQALCAESEQIGASTLEQMGRQREQLERTSGFIQQSLENTEQARQILKEMAYRALKNKIFLYCVIGVLVLANGGVLIHLWKRKT
eukprot:g12551.t1 g12551   contig6:2144199-2145295(+)